MAIKLVRPIEVEEKLEKERVRRIIAKFNSSGQLKKRVYVFKGNSPVKYPKRQSKMGRHFKISFPNFYESFEWQSLRYETLRKFGRKCMLCFASNVEVHVDHIKPLSIHPELALDPNNLQVLCRPCNVGKSNLDDTDFRPVI